MNQVTGAQLLIEFLEQMGVTTVAGIPGGAILPIYDALHGSNIRHVLARHEQGAGFIAQGISRATGKPSVAFATSGPGATNLVTALADAYADSIPVLAITGQVPQHLIGTDAFQEVDANALFAKITRRSFFVRSADELYEILPKAWNILTNGRPGPVHIDIPKDVQNARTERRAFPAISSSASLPDARLVQEAAALLRASRRPLFYIGGGITAAGASASLLQLAEEHQVPVVSSLMGLGAFPASHPLFLGMLGMHAAPFTNFAMHEADLLIAIGVRFDDRATGRLEKFCPDAMVIHADIDARELGKLRKPQVAIRADARIFLQQFREALAKPEVRTEWLERVETLRHEHPLRVPSHGSAAVALMHALGEVLDDQDIVTTDVGQHQMWAAQHLHFELPRKFLTSGGLGTMGFGIPAAMGAALETGQRVTCITGDGSVLMNIQELATLAELQLPVKIIVFDNRNLGLVRQQQQLFFGGRLSGCEFDQPADFVAIARAFGLQAQWAEQPDAELIVDFLQAPGPGLLHVPVAANEKVLPMVAPGASNLEMIREEPGLVAAVH